MNIAIYLYIVNSLRAGFTAHPQLYLYTQCLAHDRSSIGVSLVVQQICVSFERINEWIDLKLEERKPGCFVIIIKAARNTVWVQVKNSDRQERQIETLSWHVKGRNWYYFFAASFQKPNLSIDCDICCCHNSLQRSLIIRKHLLTKEKIGGNTVL